MFELEVRDVTLAYGPVDVLKNVSFKTMPGEMIGLVGPNGSGKSTLIKSLARVIEPRLGHIYINGRDSRTIPRLELAKMVGVVPQIPVLPSAFTAFEIVLMGRNPHMGTFQYESRKDIAIAWEAMERAGVLHLAERQIGELSGGEIQSVVIARSLCQKTEAILLDEPTSNLDIGRQIEILDLIKSECRERNITVIAALHDLNLAAHYCERLILIDNNGIHADGSPVEVITTNNISRVYGPGSYVHTHPLSGLPAVLPRLGNIRCNANGEKGGTDAH
ncbi:MAG: ABC transporter ATP-binding protein [Dehalococcoides mccartyi]|uniref:ABC transporter ATP-binding protein n=1 Tax=Dehalococcoides TaxID=61434 RepID=UPI002737BE91|nr:ABC transporter ATP-binding protein [Dehalococcoides mccartyi]MDP4280020.1 ABC transporter ATP-binding protein [Dehalococcoides mccartyi]